MSEAQDNGTTRSQGQFAIQRIYIKDVSFESPAAPQVFTMEWRPETQVQVTSAANRIAERNYEVVLQVTVTTRLGDKVAFIAEVKQAGLFLIEGLEGAELEHALSSHCPQIIFPYARETIADLVMRGTFPQFLLQPMNFEGLYRESKRRRETTAGDATH